ncbi:hypothetical protein D3C71_1888660 [compost metagenome]
MLSSRNSVETIAVGDFLAQTIVLADEILEIFVQALVHDVGDRAAAECGQRAVSRFMRLVALAILAL